MRKLAWVLLLLFVFAVPWEYSADFGAPLGNIARLIGVVVLLVAVLAVLRSGEIRKPGSLQVMTAAFFLWFCCSYFWSGTPDVTLVRIRGYFQEMMVVWFAWELIETADDLRTVFRVWLAGSWVLAILTIANFVSADPASAEQIRFAAVGQDPNDVARFLDLGFPFAALLLDGRESWMGKSLAIGYFPAGVAGVLLTASRGGFLTAIVALIGCGVLLFQRWPKGLIAGGLILPAVVGLVWLSAPHETLERLGTIAQQIQGGDLNQRLNIWSAGWRAFLQAPICGYGAGSFVTVAGLAPIDTAHNTILSILVEGGLIALFIAAAIVAASVRAIASTRGPLSVALGTLMMVWLLSSVVGTVAESRTTWLVLIVIAVSRRLVEEEPGELDRVFVSRESETVLMTAGQFE